MKWFKDLKISTKLISCFALIAIIAGLIGWAGLSSVSKISATASSIYSQQLIQIRNLGYANADLHAALVETRNMLLDKNVAGRQKYAELINAKDANIDGYVDIYSNCPLEKKEQDMLALFNASNEQYRQKRAKIVELLMKGHDDGAWKLMDELTEATADTSEKLKNLVAINASLAEEHQKENEATAATAKIAVLTLLVVGVLTSLILGWLTSRLFARPLRAMQSCAENLAVGDVNVTLDLESKDELGALAQAFRAMIDMITERAALAQHIASGDVTMEVKPRSAQDELGNAFLQVVNTIRKLTDEANNLTTAATQGKLATRGNAQQFSGDYRKIVEGVNATLDAVIGPLNVAADCFNKIGKGQIPQRIEEEYCGEFAVLKESVNSCITGLDGLKEVNAVLQRIALNDFTTNIEGQYPGLFGEVATATNDALLRYAVQWRRYRWLPTATSEKNWRRSRRLASDPTTIPSFRASSRRWKPSSPLWTIPLRSPPPRSRARLEQEQIPLITMEITEKSWKG